MNRQTLKSLLISTLVVSALAFGSSLTIPNNFTSGTPARASEVNANFTAVKTAVDDNHARLTRLEAAPTWTAIGDTGAPTFYAGWGNVGTPWQIAGYTKDASGFVRLRGLVKQTSGSGNIFSLPAGFRPSANLQFPARCGDGSVCGVIINSNGNVDFSGTAGAAAISFTLDGITFDPR